MEPNSLIFNFINRKDKKEKLFSDMKPDFIINNISKDNLVQIMKDREYMFRYDADFNNLENINFIFIFEKIKTNYDQYKSTNQIDRYQFKHEK